MRAFFAIPVAPPALDEGVHLLDALRAALPEVRWVRPEGLHLTLHFFEHLEEDVVDIVVDAVRTAVQGAECYTAQLAGLGCFPREGDERVLWIGMSQGAAESAALQQRVAAALQAVGYEPERRDFTPHVTLGRPRQRFDSAGRRRWQRFADSALAPFAVEELVLYRSQPGPGGSRYQALARLPLAAS